MSKIFKYKPPAIEQGVVESMTPIHGGARILTMSQVTGCVYCLVDDEQPTTQMLHLLLVGTGHEIKGLQEEYQEGSYLGLYHSGPYVWHLFGWVED